jgi:hypothetical protein
LERLVEIQYKQDNQRMKADNTQLCSSTSTLPLARALSCINRTAVSPGTVQLPQQDEKSQDLHTQALCCNIKRKILVPCISPTHFILIAPKSQICGAPTRHWGAAFMFKNPHKMKTSNKQM